nr:immunoglobulin heavy chain junction region [Mus musculus]
CARGGYGNYALAYW